ncbi:hypothetical protein ACFU5Z_16400 [Streptomyces sp. NPDC057521]|uniref:hypothetical protein n=1 Tax=Streptomyces sp. NPDC057521 TaxID=3346156 RepID=UPI0036D10E72
MTSNPYDPVERPGAHLVAEQLGLDDPWELTESYAPEDSRHIVSWLIAEAAREVDTLHLSLTRAAKAATDLLAPICRGDIDRTDRNGILMKAAPRIDVLAVQRAVAYDQLTRSIAAFRRLDPSKAPTRDREWSQQPLHETDPGPAMPRVSAALSRSTSAPEPRTDAQTPAPAPRTAPASVRPRRSPSA